MAFPVLPIIGGAATLAGAFLGRNERPPIDPEVLARLFGPDQLGADTQQLFRYLMNSPAYSEIMRSAAMRGTSLGNMMRARIAASGAGGSGVGAFAAAAGAGYGGAMQSNLLADLYMRSLGASANSLSQRASIWGNSQLGYQSQPTWSRMLGSSLLSMGSSLFDSWLTKPKSGVGPGPWSV